MSPTGRNITPPELRADQRNALNQACDMALVETINILQVKIIVCIGKFVESRVQSVLKNQGNNEIRVERITHPSPILERNTTSFPIKETKKSQILLQKAMYIV
jgi:uracil-DNA glycosylase